MIHFEAMTSGGKHRMTVVEVNGIFSIEEFVSGKPQSKKNGILKGNIKDEVSHRIATMRAIDNINMLIKFNIL